MRTLYLSVDKVFDEETSTWTLVGKDTKGEDFGVAAGDTLDAAERRLRDWVLDSLIASAADGDDRIGDLTANEPALKGGFLAFTPLDLIPIKMRAIRAKHHLSQSDVAERLGISQQAYGKLERPGANLQLRTIQQVERAVDEPILEFA